MGVWKTIRSKWETYSNRINFRVSNGRVKFWKDKWCGGLLLGEAFPALFSTATTKDTWVVKNSWVPLGVNLFGKHREGYGHWISSKGGMEVGKAFHSKECRLELTWILCYEKEEESLIVALL
ncbi:hypothetical protein CK203_088710 [Vitis vinifera]|uniref:Uncharacterized protein n=1 Tax=Vitis vinifera TaxID=29760 RepID=A0A438D434_VITVI|nr:hypothetical protein CK203_088710 [Vitis vinifera]